MIEQAISHFKNWKIMTTGCRRPIQTFAETISARNWPALLQDGRITVSIQKWRERGLVSARATRWRVVHDLRLLRVFALLRDGCGWRCPGSGGC